MRLAVKTVDGGQFYIHVDENTMAGDVKGMISEAQKHLKVEGQKLIFQGKILDDSRPLSAYNIQEKDFIVCMMAKRRGPTMDDMDEHDDGEEEELEEEEEEPEVEIDEDTVQMLHAITNAPLERIREVLQATRGNADIAAGVLMAGGGGGGGAAQAQFDFGFMGAPQSHPPGPTLQQPPQPTPGGAASPDLMSLNLIPPSLLPQAQAPAFPQSPLAQFQNSPEFQSLRAQVQSDPSQLQAAITQIGARSPQLLQAIQQHPDEFLAMLNAPAGAPPHSPPTMAPQASSPTPSGPLLSPQDEESISRLQSFGFDRRAAIEAYLACDKNEEAAANLLFDS